MRKIGWIVILGFTMNGWAQNLELNSGKDIRQPGKINPALAGIQEDLIRILSDAEVGQSYQLMLEGHIPFNIGNFMIGAERTFTDDVSNDMFNFTYARRKKRKDKKLQWRYGASFQFNTKTLATPLYDSSAGGFVFKDIDGLQRVAPTLDHLRTGIEYFDAELGAAITYKNLMLGASLQNFIGANVSMTTLEKRTVPFSANLMLGGFINLGKKATIFPSAIVFKNKDQFYAKAGLDFSTKHFNISSAFITDNDFSEINASAAYKFRKIFAGIEYTQPVAEGANLLLDVSPTINLFINSTLFKSRSLFKSKFAKQMKKLY